MQPTKGTLHPLLITPPVTTTQWEPNQIGKECTMEKQIVIVPEDKLKEEQ